MTKYISAAAAAALFFAPLLADAQQISIPQVQSIGSSDLFQDVVNGQPGAASYYAPAQLLGSYSNTLPGGNSENALVGGDFTTNLFQRGTSVSLTSSTYYVAYVADRWFGWGGTSTPGTFTQQADAPSAYLDSLRVNKGSLTGVKQLCVAQEVESVNSYRFQGQTAEFDVHLKAGSTFSAASSNVSITISYGTGTDEGSTYYAYGLNTQGGAGTTAWTGQVNFTQTVPINTAWNRYSVVAPIPTTATEVAVAVCYTPVGTGSSTDWFEIAGAQLVPNASLTSVAGTGGAALNANDTRAKSFARRPQQVETALQQRYHYRLTETNGLYAAAAMCSATNVERIIFPIPVPFRATPTLTSATAAGGFKYNLAGTNTAIGTLTLVTGSQAGWVTLGDTVTCTAGGTAFLNGSATTGIIDLDAEL